MISFIIDLFILQHTE